MTHPTVTQRVRAFLDAEGVSLAPWATLDETYARLYGLLAARRDERAFWPSLEALLASLAEGVAGDGDARPVAELLGRGEIERLVADLRRALPAAGHERGPLIDFTASLAAPALCGFLLLGLAAAAGCSNPSAKDGNASPPPAAPPPAAMSPPLAPHPAKAAVADAGPPIDTPRHVDAAWFDGCALDHRGTLWRHIDRAALGDADKRALCDCFDGLDGRWTGRLSFLFRNARPAEVAKVLEEMVACCEAEDKAANESCRDVDKTETAVRKRTAPPLEGLGGVLYKGVAFGRSPHSA